MHHSRLTAIAIDSPPASFDATTRFWRGTFGSRAEDVGDDDDYQTVGNRGGTTVFVQRIHDGPARIHLDIETDSIEDEVQRLERLGAKRIRKVHSWWVMEDPAGNAFCVVAPQTDDFPGDAAQWP